VVAALAASSPPAGGITINGQTIQQMVNQAVQPPQRPVAQRLAELETLRTTGVLTEAEYAHKREQIISEI